MVNINEYPILAKEDWSDVDLGDKRLRDRAVKIGAEFLRNPFASLPKMLKEFKDVKAFYRFMDSNKVTHERLVSPHIDKSRTRMHDSAIMLAVQDSTTLTFKRNYDIEGLYDVGNIPGIVVHNAISVIPHPNHGIIDGLLHQIIHKRKPKKSRTKEDSEIELWTEGIECIGKPKPNTTIIDVMDRGADASEVMNCSLQNGHEFIIRAKYNRFVDDKDYKYLFEYARSLGSIGQKKMTSSPNPKGWGFQ